MANGNNDNNQDKNNNNNDDNGSPFQPRRNLLLEAFNSVRTPPTKQEKNWLTKTDWSATSSTTRHTQCWSKHWLDNNTLWWKRKKKKKEEKEEEEEERAENEKEKEESITTTTTDNIGGVEIAFDNATPTQTHKLRWLYDL